MEQNQTPDANPTTSLFQMNLDAQNSYNLRTAASWAKVLGVVGIITGAIIIILMLIAMNQLSGYSGYGYSRRGFGGMLGGAGATKMGLWIMIVSGIIFVLGGVFSFGFGNKINIALRSNDQNGLNTAFAALRNYFALRSITVIIVLLFLFLALTNSM
jgi:hypothetical protein